MPTEVIEAPPGSLGLPGFDEIEDVRNGPDIGGPWIVILYNCDCHTFDDVIGILQKATGCSVEKAFAYALEVHTKGRSVVYSGSRDDCDKVASIIASIRLQVETDHI